ncbi:MAG: hypothetical protein NZT61_03580 [Deltaproteobacteria bacterium]|nr:hypothetical protein [Deltaproteobacteria bacterium]MCX7953019.1 hypothetical protein [Deltaproteobacteria bacterium]
MFDLLSKVFDLANFEFSRYCFFVHPSVESAPSKKLKRLAFEYSKQNGLQKTKFPEKEFESYLYSNLKNGSYVFKIDDGYLFPFPLRREEKFVGLIKTRSKLEENFIVFFPSHTAPSQQLLNEFLGIVEYFLDLTSTSEAGVKSGWSRFLLKSNLYRSSYPGSFLKILVVSFMNLSEARLFYGESLIENFIISLEKKVLEIEEELDVIGYISPFIEAIFLTPSWNCSKIKIELERFVDNFHKVNELTEVTIHLKSVASRLNLIDQVDLEELLAQTLEASELKIAIG